MTQRSSGPGLDGAERPARAGRRSRTATGPQRRPARSRCARLGHRRSRAELERGRSSRKASSRSGDGGGTAPGDEQAAGHNRSRVSASASVAPPMTIRPTRPTTAGPGRPPAAARSRSTVLLRAIVCSHAGSEPSRRVNVSARSHSARKVSCTTSSAIPRSDVNRLAERRSRRHAGRRAPPGHRANPPRPPGQGPRRCSTPVGAVIGYAWRMSPRFRRVQSAASGASQLPAARARGRRRQRPGRQVRLQAGHAARIRRRHRGRSRPATRGDRPSPARSSRTAGRPKRIEPSATTMTLS